MTLDYSVPGQVSVNMSHYVKKMVKEFPQENLKGAPVASLWNENLFKVQHDSAPLEKDQAERFHTMTVEKSMVIWILHRNSLSNYIGTKAESFLEAQGYPIKENILYQVTRELCCSRPMGTRVQASTLIISTSNTSMLLTKRPKVTLKLNIAQQTR